jgi:molybdate transport system ATP-binding protein
MLDTCGIRRLGARKFLTLSYGEKRLVLLARALVQEPDWLLLDEPYNGLDGEYRRRVDDVLAAVRTKGQSWVATAHRAMDVPSGTRSLIELSAGRIRRRKRASDADFAQLRVRAGEVRPQASRRRRKPSKPKTADAPLLLRLIDVDLYVGYRAVLRALNWQLRQGEHWSVFGANGAGKSSFLKLLYGDLAPSLGGKIERAGCPRGAPIFEWKRRVGFVSPELQGLYATSSDVLELVASGRHSSIGLAAPMTAAERASARTWLAFFNMRSLAGRPARELSYGQLRRALIARAMAAEPQILLLDEPFTGLDPKQRGAMKRLLQRLMRRQVTIVAAVHHAEDLPRGMTRELHLHKRQARVADSHFAT